MLTSKKMRVEAKVFPRIVPGTATVRVPEGLFDSDPPPVSSELPPPREPNTAPVHPELEEEPLPSSLLVSGSIGPRLARASPASCSPRPGPAGASQSPNEPAASRCRREAEHSQMKRPDWLQRGEKIGLYEIQDRVGMGGFGALYRATRDGKDYALKIPLSKPQEMAQGERDDAEERLGREVGTLLMVRHPNVVRVREFFRWPSAEEGFVCIVMDFIRGQPFYRWMRESAPSLRSVLTAMASLGRALDDLHRHNIHHRDIKSSNVLVTDAGEPVLVDFGIARPRSAFTVTHEATLLGTYTHWAPEYVAFFQTSEFEEGVRFPYAPTTDLYALGNMMYGALCGREPHWYADVDSSSGVLPGPFVDALLGDRLEPPSKYNPALPPAVDEICLKLLAKNPAHRFQSGAALADELEAWLAAEAGNEKLAAPLKVPPPPGPKEKASAAASERAMATTKGRSRPPPLPPPTPLLPPPLPPPPPISPARLKAVPSREANGKTEAPPAPLAAAPPPAPPPRPVVGSAAADVRRASGVPTRGRSRPPPPPLRPLRASSHLPAPHVAIDGQPTRPSQRQPARSRREAQPLAQANPVPPPLPLAASPAAPHSAPPIPAAPVEPVAAQQAAADNPLPYIPPSRMQAPEFVSPVPVPEPVAAPAAEAAKASEPGKASGGPTILVPALGLLNGARPPRSRFALLGLSVIGLLAFALLAVLLSDPLPRPLAPKSLLSQLEKDASARFGESAPPEPFEPPALGPTPDAVDGHDVPAVTVKPLVPARPAKRRGRSVDAQQVDALLAQEYGNRPLPAFDVDDAVTSADLPSWMKQSKRAAPKATPTGSAEGAAGTTVPMGAEIRVRLQKPLDSRTVGSGPVVGRLPREFTVGRRVVLPRGTMVYGTAVANGAGRFDIRFTRLRLPDNTELQFEGLAMDADDKKPGLAPSRRISVSPTGAGLVSRLIKGTASGVLSKVTGGDAVDVARSAGETVLGHEEGKAQPSEALLLDAPRDFLLFVTAGF